MRRSESKEVKPSPCGREKSIASNTLWKTVSKPKKLAFSVESGSGIM